MTMQPKRLVRLVCAIFSIAGIFLASHSTASNHSASSATGSVITTNPHASLLPSQGKTDNPNVDLAYVQTLHGEELLTIDRSTNTIIARTRLDNHREPAKASTNNQPSVSNLNTPNSGTGVIATIPVLAAPHGVAANPTNNRIYVTALQDGKLQTIDGTTNSVITTTAVGTNPHSVVANISTNRIYVTNNHSDSVSVVDGASSNVITTINGLASYPVGIAVDSTRNFTYAVHGGDKLSVINGGTSSVSNVIDTGFANGYVAINPTNNRAYVTKNTPGKVAVVDVSTSKTITDILVGGKLDGIAVNPITNRVFAANNATNTLAIIDAATNTLLSSVMVGSGPTDVAVNSDTNCIYVANAGSSSVSIIDGSTNRLVGTISVGTDPKSIAVNPVTHRVYIANRGSNTVSVIQDEACGEAALPTSTPTTTPSNGPVFNKKVYVLVLDPLLRNGQKLSEYLHWNNYITITKDTIDFFKQASGNRLNYTVVATTIETNGWPEKTDGFRYTEDTYLASINGQSQPHNPDTVDYVKLINNPAYDICGKVNRGEIDELWVYNGPNFGFYESRLVGPGAYWYNSPPITGGTSCNKLLPIMGPSPQAPTGNAIHNFGHRTEATMTKIYGSWEQNRTTHNWERFALTKALSPSYNYSGCGNIHYPPNSSASKEYDYENQSAVNSNCDDFANYPNLGDPAVVARPVTCSAWGCTDIGYYGYWFRHLPASPGCGTDGVANDWWQYFADPALALAPSSVCQTAPTQTPTATPTTSSVNYRVFLPLTKR